MPQFSKHTDSLISWVPIWTAILLLVIVDCCIYSYIIKAPCVEGFSLFILWPLFGYVVLYYEKALFSPLSIKHGLKFVCYHGLYYNHWNWKRKKMVQPCSTLQRC